MLLVSLSRPAFADVCTFGGVYGLGSLCAPYYFLAEDREDNNKDKTIKFDIGLVPFFESTLLYYLNDSNLVGINVANNDDRYYRSGLFQERRYFIYRAYVLRKIFGEVGVGGARTAYRESSGSYSYSYRSQSAHNFESATYLRTAAKLTLGVEAQANWIGISFYGTYRYLGNGTRIYGQDVFYAGPTADVNQDELQKKTREKSTDSEYGMALTFAI